MCWGTKRIDRDMMRFASSAHTADTADTAPKGDRIIYPVNTRLVSASERILLALWVGSLWVAGFVVAPLLFAELDDRALAGSVAGSLFTLTSYIGLVSGSLLLVFNGVSFRRINWRAAVIVGMLLLVVVGQYVITPMVADLRVQGLTDTPRFGQLHGLASVLFILTSVLGLVLVAAGQQGRD